MMSKRTTNVFVSALLTTIAADTAFAIPVEYQFTTGTQASNTFLGNPVVIPVDPRLQSLAGLSVSGSFEYDADAPVSMVFGPQPDPTQYSAEGATSHAGALSNLRGTIGGSSFFDPNGAVQVGDNKVYLPAVYNQPPRGLDLLELTANFDSNLGALPDTSADLDGFSIDGLQLVNVRMYWIYGAGSPPVPDFLTETALPPVLPDLNGRVALDFYDAVNNARAIYFVDGLSVVSVPEPGSLALFAVGLLSLGGLRGAGRGASKRV